MAKVSVHSVPKVDLSGPEFVGPGLVYVPPTKGAGAGPTCVDLFAGAGGLAEGFRQAGWRVLLANDYDADASETFILNFPEAGFLFGSVTDIDPVDLRRRAGLRRKQLDCLIGGPPCQSFSYNNHQRSATDERAGLFRAYLSIVEELLPRTLLMENVPGMLTIGGGKIIKEICRRLAMLGYRCEIKVICAEEFGVPQTRRRLFIVGTRHDQCSPLIPAGTHGPIKKSSNLRLQFVHRWTPRKGTRAKPLVTVDDAIGDLPVIRSGGGRKITNYRTPPKTAYQRLLRGRSKKVHDHTTQGLSPSVMERIKHVPQGGNWRDIPRKLLPPGMARARTSDHTKRYGRLDPSSLASTVLTKCDPHWGEYVHPTQNRAISIREAARLQGFPDTFRFAGELKTKLYRQVGNAVPVPVAFAFGKHLAKLLRETRST
jgi:DNA (cytosine-5)-methyltransferase 1